jgi:4-hydroxy-tetrahydrodipicolinate synthase
VLGGDDAFLFPTVLVGAIFAEPNPAVVKALMHAAGRIPTPDVRMPLSAASAEALE